MQVLVKDLLKALKEIDEADEDNGRLTVKVRIATKLYNLYWYDNQYVARIEEPMKTHPGGGPYFCLLDASDTDEVLEG